VCLVWGGWGSTTGAPGRPGFDWPTAGAARPLVCPPAPDGLRVGSFVALALNTRPPRTTWLQPGPSFSCSGERQAGADFGAGRREETPSLWPRSPCARFAAPAFASFHLLQPRPRYSQQGTNVQQLSTKQ
jgi:hypothetical protein